MFEIYTTVLASDACVIHKYLKAGAGRLGRRQVASHVNLINEFSNEIAAVMGMDERLE